MATQHQVNSLKFLVDEIRDLKNIIEKLKACRGIHILPNSISSDPILTVASLTTSIPFEDFKNILVKALTEKLTEFEDDFRNITIMKYPQKVESIYRKILELFKLEDEDISLFDETTLKDYLRTLTYLK